MFGMQRLLVSCLLLTRLESPVSLMFETDFGFL